MKDWLKWTLFAAAVGLMMLGWVFYFHNEAVAAKLPKWGWVQKSVAFLGEKKAAAEPDDDDPDNTKNEIPVHTAHVSVATLHRYVEGFGMVGPRPPRNGQPAGAANLASPVAGVVGQVLKQVGQQVKAGEAVIQLDDRLAKSAEEQAAAALEQAQASLAALKATPRADQLQIAQLGVEKAQSALQFAKQNYERQKTLIEGDVVSRKTVEQAAMDLGGAKTDLAIAEKQLAILKSSPTPQELHQEEAKVAQAIAALATARVQRQMMTIASPLDATVVAIMVNSGESVDTTKTLVQLVALDRLIVSLDVPADQLPANAQGLAAQILLSTTPTANDNDTAIVGKVAFVSPQVDPRNGAVNVGIDLPASAPLRPGLTVRVRIVTQEHKDCLAVPKEAVVSDENGDSVISVVEKDQATHKTVKAGLEENGLIEISADGLTEGTTVVSAGAYGLPAASRVKVLD
jgi:multidrug efflux pump subunit AcrA (membrane-fusion protein)